MIKRPTPILQPKKDLLSAVKRALADADTRAAGVGSKTVRIPAPRSASVSPTRITRPPAG